MSSYRAAPAWTADMIFESWKAEIYLWVAVTDLKEEQQAAAVTLTVDYQKGEVAKGLSLQEDKRWFGQLLTWETCQTWEPQYDSSRQCVGLQVTVLLEYRCQRANDGNCDQAKTREQCNEVFTETNFQRYCKCSLVFERTSEEEPVFVASDQSAKAEETAFCVDKRRNKRWQCQRGRGRGNFKNAGRNPVDAKGNVTT